jgi:Ni/Co efflux regulator RcnB
MKRFYLSAIGAGLALAVMSGPLAVAQQYQNHDDSHGMAPAHEAWQHGQMPNAGMDHAAPSHYAAPQHEMASQHEMAPQHYMAPAHDSHMAYQAHPETYANHGWHNGDHYTGGRMVVGNWQAQHLRQPPHGYEWVQNNGQYVLIAVTSGIIADVVANALIH